jgi:hypothetical protein
MQYAVRWPWEMTITTALFTFVLALALRMRHIGDSPQSSVPSSHSQPASASPTQLTTSNQQLTTGSWLLFSLLWALIALSNSTLLIFLPVCGLWIVWPSLRNPRAYFGPTLAALFFLLCLTPWTIRNFEVFHTFIPLRGNFGAELYMGNGPGSNGLLMEYYHPFQDAYQLGLYANFGEVRYVALRGALAKANIAAHPAHFAADILRRIDFFWAGVPHPTDEAWYNELGRTLNFSILSIAGLLGLALALKRRIPAAGLFACAFLLLPIPYYFVTVHARFRHPLEPLIAILAVYLFQSADRTRIFTRR